MMDTYDLYDPYGDDQSEQGDVDMDFLEVELVRSTFIQIKSDGISQLEDGNSLKKTSFRTAECSSETDLLVHL